MRLGGSRTRPSVVWLPHLNRVCTAGERVKQGSYKDSQVIDNLHEDILVFTLAQLSYEGIPLSPVPFGEPLRNGLDLVRRNRSFSIPERRFDGVKQRIGIKFEVLRANPYVVEVLHATIGVTERHHGLKLL